MRSSNYSILVAAAMMLAVPAMAAKHGVFRNPSGSVHVRVADCGRQLCGTIVWADEKARADSAKAGQKNIIGMQLFRDLKPVPQPAGKPRRWEGDVYIPDKDRTVSGNAVLDGRTLRVEGCLLGDKLCKGQDWVRVK
ncbi:MAG: DUF2147 domain-containing protein [Sandarakinorhabdus sp.]|nr:DUF2147 domain-containing protein [Sandarakinorhabdus sp.]